MSIIKETYETDQKVDKSKIGSTIKATRQQKGYTQAELARLCHLPRPTLCNIERGHSLPSLQTILTISSVLETSIDQLLHTEPHDNGDGENVYLEMSRLLVKCKGMDRTMLDQMLQQAVEVINNIP